MTAYFLTCFQIFFLVLEALILLYLVAGMLPFGIRFHALTVHMVYPMLYPLQKLLKRSVLGAFSVDVSSYVALLILNYLRYVMEYLNR